MSAKTEQAPVGTCLGPCRNWGEHHEKTPRCAEWLAVDRNEYDSTPSESPTRSAGGQE